MNLIRLFVPFPSLPPPSGSGYQARSAAMATIHLPWESHRRLPPKWLLLPLPVTFSRFLAVFKPFLQWEENGPPRSHTPLNLSVYHVCYCITRPYTHKLCPRDLETRDLEFANLAFGSDFQDGIFLQTWGDMCSLRYLGGNRYVSSLGKLKDIFCRILHAS